MQLPILKFHNIFKSVIWGGTRIADFKGIPPQGDNIGESWEISPLQGKESIVDGGVFDKLTINELTERHPAEILGSTVTERYGNRFPLLIKFLDSNADLSVQVHPDDTLAAERHNDSGKAELWYSIAPAKGAYYYAGFKEKLSKEQFRHKIADNSIISSLHKFKAKAGDVVPIPAGRIHSLGPGNFVCEIQQASDLTYRIYDFDRRDSDGNPRELHVEESIDALNFDDLSKNVSNVAPSLNKDVVLDFSQHFLATLLSVGNRGTLDLPQGKSFTVFVCIDGSALLHDPDGNVTPIRRGTTVLIPASMPTVEVEPTAEKVDLITVSIIN